MNSPTEFRTDRADDAPADGYGVGFLEYSIRTSFRDLCRLYVAGIIGVDAKELGE